MRRGDAASDPKLATHADLILSSGIRQMTSAQIAHVRHSNLSDKPRRLP
jgi:hypothetical protein